MPKSLARALRKADRKVLKRKVVQGRRKEECPKISTGDRLLGAQMQYSKANPGKRSLHKRFEQADQACIRIASVPLGVFQRGELTESVVIPNFLFDVPVSPLSKRAMNKWRASTAKATRGGGSRFRCNETLFSLLCRGHAVDPLEASICRIIQSAKRLLSKHPQQTAQLVETMRVRQEGPLSQVQRVMGPGRQLLWALERVGWSSDGNFHIYTRGGQHEFALRDVY